MRLHKLLGAALIGAAMMLSVTARAQAGVLGSDSAACAGGAGPAIRANVSGLKDRSGELKLELYPANDADFLKDDRDLIKEGKFFRRIRVPTPQSARSRFASRHRPRDAMPCSSPIIATARTSSISGSMAPASRAM